MLAVYMLSAQLITVATKSLKEFMDKWEWLMFTVLILRAIADVLISGSLVYHLVRCRHGTLKSTVAIVDKLILWSIETGIVTSMLGFLSIILYLTLKTTYAWLALLMFIPKGQASFIHSWTSIVSHPETVFSNAMLANMNSRVELQNMSRSVVDSTGVFTTGAFAAVPFGPVSVSAHTTEIRSNVEDSTNEIYWASTMEQGADHKLPELTSSGESSESGTVDK
ncbi:hypothetical protein F5050DRAFT_1812124 [Lentinula boryana]|uniref:DUF6534 domain-containing protein n=1 Tax=Lentinula boryana TaxID=40481 RepID=A0ABQ8Q069_9AGAR|nr:hypothetical protein F5050DRAFT_1812124 [Lentinula boryana]